MAIYCTTEHMDPSQLVVASRTYFPSTTNLELDPTCITYKVKHVILRLAKSLKPINHMRHSNAGKKTSRQMFNANGQKDSTNLLLNRLRDMILVFLAARVLERFHNDFLKFLEFQCTIWILSVRRYELASMYYDYPHNKLHKFLNTQITI